MHGDLDIALLRQLRHVVKLRNQRIPAKTNPITNSLFAKRSERI